MCLNLSLFSLFDTTPKNVAFVPYHAVALECPFRNPLDETGLKKKKKTKSVELTMVTFSKFHGEFGHATTHRALKGSMFLQISLHY